MAGWANRGGRRRRQAKVSGVRPRKHRHVNTLARAAPLCYPRRREEGERLGRDRRGGIRITRTCDARYIHMLIIRDFRDIVLGDRREISAEVDGDRVFFRVPAHFPVSCCAEPFVGIALLEAMVRNIDIDIQGDVAISEKLMHALPEIQRVYACWNTDLHPICVHARTRREEIAQERVASYFSGGVDGSYTLACQFDDITHLIMLSGFELAGNTPESWRCAVENNSAFARTIGKELVPVETNAKEWTDGRRIYWGFAQGLILSSLASLFGAKRLYIASSHTYNELFPTGSHPLTDPMWSTESTTIVHHGAAARRSDKMKELCRHPVILDNLKVCWASLHENCGACPKCVRTMAALHLLGASTPALPAFEGQRGQLRPFIACARVGASYLEDALLLARERGHSKIHRTLKRYYQLYQLLVIMKIVDKYFLGGLVRRVYRNRRSRKTAGGGFRVGLIGGEGWEV